ncbi:MAG: flavodoxin [Treponemataceae bacterium]|nr:flavodoxin [Treponemataceae bacterium]
MKKLIGTATLIAAFMGAAFADTQKQPDGWQGRKVLVAYYSATGTTKAVAEKIAGILGADLFAIKPELPYSAADLDWTDKSSRVCKEHDIIFGRKASSAATAADVNRLPVTLKSAAPDFARYDTIFIGYPIWWGIAAWPANAFAAQNDFSGKTVIPFSTAISSGFGRSGELLKDLAQGKGTWLSGRGFRTRTTENDVRSWLAEIGAKR